MVIFMNTLIGVSRRHVHLTESIWKILFGDEEIKVRNYINQPGQYASLSTVDLYNGDKVINHVRVVGPLRDYNQVEVSLTDALELELNPPRRQSKDLDGAASITLVGPCGKVYLENVLILAETHIHMESDMMIKYGFVNREVVNVYRDGKYLFKAKIKESNPGFLECHIDTDEALEYGLNTGDEISFEKII